VVVALHGEWAPIDDAPDGAIDAHDGPNVADGRLTATGLAFAAADGRRMRSIVQTFHVDAEHRAAVGAASPWRPNDAETSVAPAAPVASATRTPVRPDGRVAAA
jgi:hypothetical protein